jgi:hypothetical protein
MRTRPLTIAILAALAAMTSVTPADASRSCRVLPGGGAPHTVSIFHGRLSCAQARTVAKSYVHGGTFHGPINGPRSAQYLTLPGGWRCSVIEQGGASCARGGTRANPSELIGFTLD